MAATADASVPAIVCVGLATRDTIVPMPRWPDPDGRLVVGPIVRSGGGPAATAAVAIARLGGRVAFVGAVGPDGDDVIEALERAGVDVSLVRRVEGPTAESVILLDGSAATRTILHAPGASLTMLDPPAARACAGAAWIHVDHAGYGLADAVDRSRTSVDAGNPIPGLRLAGLGLYAPTAASLMARYPGTDLPAAVAAALDEGAERVVMTAGADGALAAGDGGAWRIPSYRVEVLSTLGAGDVFHGALVAALADGHALPDAARRASVAAALSCRSLDGRAAIPSLDELEATLRDAPPPEPIVLEPRA